MVRALLDALAEATAMMRSAPLTDTFSALRARAFAPRAAGLRVDFLARCWAEYRYSDTIFAHLGGHALLQTSALLVADRFSLAAVSAGAIVADDLFLAALGIQWAPAVMMAALHVAVLVGGRWLQRAAGPDAL